MQSKILPPSKLWSKYVGRDHFESLLSATGLPKDAFLSDYVPVAEKLTLCVLDLPLMPSVFSGVGGALQCALQSGLLTLRMCDAQIFEPQATAQERQQNDPKWRWLAYCASLASVYLICAGNVRVQINGNDFSFAHENPIGNFTGHIEAEWELTETQTNQAGLIYLQAFFYPGQFGNVPPSMLNAFAGAINPAMSVSPHETPLARVVRTAITQVLEAQRKRDAKIIEPVPSGVYADVTPHDIEVKHKPDPLKPAQEKSAENEKEVESKPSGQIEKPASPIPENPSPPRVVEINHGMPSKLAEWIKALAHIRSMDAEITIEPKRIRLGRKALGFGATPKENYEFLYKAGVVLDKGADFAWCDKRVADLYCAEKELSIAK